MKSISNNFIMGKITNEEISTLVANQIKELELSGVFNEDTLGKIQEKVSSRLGDDGKVLEEEVTSEQEEGEVEVAATQAVAPTEEPAAEAPVVTPAYEPELPAFIDKIDPAKFVIFDMNEVSLGGEQLSNKPFRLYADPDVKKSIHDTWTEEGKKTGEVYIAKFEKIGKIEFDYKNGTTHFTEKRFQNPEEMNSSPVYQDNPYATESTPQEVDNKPVEMAVNNAVDVEGQVKSYIEDILKQHFAQGMKVDPSIDAEPVYAVQDEVQNQMVGQESIHESSLKYKEIVMNDKEYLKIDTPQNLKESMKSGNGAAKLIAKNEQVQTWILEGVEYYLPTEIISDKKCHTKNVETL